jgi:hypothetical protein
MSYFKPKIDETGFYYPSYPDIRDAMIEDYKSIYGEDMYLENDSADYQWICTQAQYIYDCYQAMESVYNSRSPLTAIGKGLDSIVKINAIKRNKEEFSECMVTVRGIAGSTIQNGIVVDKSNIQWNLDEFTLDSEGTANVKATCSISGPIIANIGDIYKVYNPSYEWTSVSNSEKNYKTGRYLENDTELRQRQSLSTMKSSKTLVEGIKAELLSLADVKKAEVYENDTDSVNSLGLPAHSITCILDGGDDIDIANCIYVNKTPGCYTNGSEKIVIKALDDEDMEIRFDRKIDIYIDVEITIKKLEGFTDSTISTIKNSVYTYLNCLDIGNDVNISVLWGMSLSTMNYSKPTFSITSIKACTHGGILDTNDIDIPYNCISRGKLDYITIKEV